MARPRSSRDHHPRGRPWWLASAAAGAAFTLALVVAATTTAGRSGVGTLNDGDSLWWIVTGLLHVPYIVILLFLFGGMVERVGYYWRGRTPALAGQLPPVPPTVCVQLPMFNEHAVARRGRSRRRRR